MTERDLQKQVVQYLKVALPRGWDFFHPVNEGKRSLLANVDLARQGMRAGLPDLVIYRPGFIGFIELKSKTGRMQPSQLAFQAKSEANHVPYQVCRSLPEVQGVLAAWGIIPTARAA